MSLAIGIALVMAIVWSDSCKRHLWESMGPVHYFSCRCSGFRNYCPEIQPEFGFAFRFRLNPPDEAHQDMDRGTLHLTILELAGPKTRSSFIALQLGDHVICSRPLEAATSTQPQVQQRLQLPIPQLTRNVVYIFLYGKSHINTERLVAIGRITLDSTRMHGVHDITAQLYNFNGDPSGHLRCMIRVGAPGSTGFASFDLVPYVADSAEVEEDDTAAIAVKENDKRPIVVFSAGGKASIAVPELPANLKPMPISVTKSGSIANESFEGVNLLRNFLSQSGASSTA